MKYIKIFNNSIDKEIYRKSKFVSPHLFLNKEDLRDIHYLEEYEELEYISSTATGGQYINLGCKLMENNDDIHIDIKFKINGNGKNTSNQGALLGNQGPVDPYPGFVIRTAGNNIEGFAKWEFTNSKYANNRYYHNKLASTNNSSNDGYNESVPGVIYNISWTLDNIPNNQLSSTLNTCLFCNAIDNNSASNFVNADLYFLKIRKGDLYINLIPVRKKKTNEVGLYDIENDKFYISEGSEQFIGHELPKAYKNLYRRLEYISSTKHGSEYIDLGTKLMETNEDIQIDIKFEFIGKGYDDIAQAALLTLNYEDNSTWPGIVLRDRKNAGGKLELETKCNFTGSVNSGNKYYYVFNNGTEQFPAYGKNIIFEESMLINNIPDNQCHDGSTYIFSSYKYYDTQGPWRYSEAKIYYLRIYKGGVLVHDLIPMLRIEDNVAGLYDYLNGIFYKSNGVNELQESESIDIKPYYVYWGSTLPTINTNPEKELSHIIHGYNSYCPGWYCIKEEDLTTYKLINNQITNTWESPTFDDVYTGDDEEESPAHYLVLPKHTKASMSDETFNEIPGITKLQSINIQNNDYDIYEISQSPTALINKNLQFYLVYDPTL